MQKNIQRFSAFKGSQTVWAVFDTVPAKSSLVTVGSMDTIEMYPKCAKGSTTTDRCIQVYFHDLHVSIHVYVIMKL